MDPIINEIIPKQGFEIVSELIGAVLKLEIENQKQLMNAETPNSFPYDIKVYHERITPIGVEEEAVINVLLGSSNYSGLTRKDTQGATIFFVDVYTNSKESQDHTGDVNSSKLLMKLMGLVRYILSHTEYKTLTLQPGLIAGTQVDGFDVMQPNYREDSSFSRMSRISVSYKIQESQSMPQGSPLDSSTCNVKLGETDLGYEYLIFNQ